MLVETHQVIAAKEPDGEDTSDLRAKVQALDKELAEIKKMLEK